MIIPGSGAYISTPALAALAPRLLDLLAEDQYRSDAMPDQFREEWREAANFGMDCRKLVLRKVRANTSEHSLASECSSPSPLAPMNTKQVAKLFGVGVRAVQRRAERKSLPATRSGRAWLFDAAEIDRVAKGAP